jgi:two-component system chemotaxis response regulator CheY
MATILVVDDSGMSRRTLRRILEPAGHAVIEESEGLAAIERYFLDRPDLVLLDMTMAGMHGLDVLARLREMDPHACVIVATADVQRSTRELAQAAGGTGFIAKPFDAEEVLRAIQVVLAGADR